MATTAQTLANRENARHSTGPRTPEGKSRSATNATRHGLVGVFSVLPSESEADYNELLEGYASEFQPESFHEKFLVAEMAQARWRILRIDRLEGRLLAEASGAQEGEASEADQAGAESSPTPDPDAKLLAAMRAATPDLFSLFRRYRLAAERSYYNALRETRVCHDRKILLQAFEIRKRAAEATNELVEMDRSTNRILDEMAQQTARMMSEHAAVQNEPNRAPQPMHPAARTAPATHIRRPGAL